MRKTRRLPRGPPRRRRSAIGSLARRTLGADRQDPDAGQSRSSRRAPGSRKRCRIGDLTSSGDSWFPGRTPNPVWGNEPGRGGPPLRAGHVGGEPRPITPGGRRRICRRPISARTADPSWRVGPDGRVAIYPARARGEPRPVPGSRAGGLPLRWTADGRSLYVARLSALPGQHRRRGHRDGQRADSGRRSQPPDPAGVEQVGPILIAPDGSPTSIRTGACSTSSSSRRECGSVDLSLAAGTRLGPYEILAPLGAGGMGEVYRARDAKLGREIAIKVLPAAVASDAGPPPALRAGGPLRLGA